MDEKPLPFMRALVQSAPVGATILDPFMGSGTTGVAAISERRRFVGVELIARHWRTAYERISAAAVGRKTSDSIPPRRYSGPITE